MKPTQWLLPVLAAVSTASFIFSQKHLAATLNHEISVISERVRLARSEEASAPTANQDPSPKTATPPGKIDWIKLSKNSSRQHFGNDMRSTLRTQRILMGFSTDELIAQLDEIDSLNLDPKARDELRRMILEPLSKKNPQLALERFRDQLNENGGLAWSLSNAFTNWAKKDSTAALAWLDQQIAAGAFESKTLDVNNAQQNPFEVAAFNLLMDSSPAAAESRLAAMPESQREQILNSSVIQNATSKNLEAYSALVRRQLSPKNAARVLASGAQMCVHRGGLEKVDTYLTTIQATPTEKTSIVKQSISTQLGRTLSSTSNPKEELDKAREWGAKHDPTVVDTSIGESIARMLWQNPNFEKSAEIILNYHATSQNDDALVSFLRETGSNQKFREKSLELARQIKDPTRREEMLQSLSPKSKSRPSNFPCPSPLPSSSSASSGVAMKTSSSPPSAKNTAKSSSKPPRSAFPLTPINPKPPPNQATVSARIPTAKSKNTLNSSPALPAKTNSKSPLKIHPTPKNSRNASPNSSMACSPSTRPNLKCSSLNSKPAPIWMTTHVAVSSVLPSPCSLKIIPELPSRFSPNPPTSWAKK